MAGSSDSVSSAEQASKSASNILPGLGSSEASNAASSSEITTIHAEEEFQQILDANPEKLVCLMCKALGCRPCKVFSRKYQRAANTFKDCLFLEVIGDESTDLRKMMISMNVRATPTFKLYRGGECVKVHVGIDEDKLRNAIREHVKEGEAGFEA